MLGRKYTILAPIALVAAFGLAACEGDTGPQGPAGLDGIDGQDGLGYVPVPAADETLADYDPASEGDQTIGGQIGGGNTVWEIPIDGGIAANFGDGGDPVIGTAVRYDNDHDEMWIEVDGTWIPFTDFIMNEASGDSLGCTAGVPTPCVIITVEGGPYAEIAKLDIQHGPATDAVAYGHYGVQTAAADMPADGEADYVDGISHYVVRIDGVPVTTADGSPNINVDFGTGAVTYNDSPSAVTGVLTIDESTATIVLDGNSYSSVGEDSVTGAYDPSEADGDELAFSSGDLSGIFYGPSADTPDGEGFLSDSETAGVLSASDTDATDLDIGGDGEGTSSIGSVEGVFWVEQDSYTPPEI